MPEISSEKEAEHSIRPRPNAKAGVLARQGVCSPKRLPRPLQNTLDTTQFRSVFGQRINGWHVRQQSEVISGARPGRAEQTARLRNIN